MSEPAPLPADPPTAETRGPNDGLFPSHAQKEPPVRGVPAWPAPSPLAGGQTGASTLHMICPFPLSQAIFSLALLVSLTLPRPRSLRSSNKNWKRKAFLGLRRRRVRISNIFWVSSSSSFFFFSSQDMWFGFLISSADWTNTNTNMITRCDPSMQIVVTNVVYHRYQHQVSPSMKFSQGQTIWVGLREFIGPAWLMLFCMAYLSTRATCRRSCDKDSQKRGGKERN